LIIQQGFVVGIGIVLGSVNVFFRDVGQFLQVILQFWFWFTPIVYPMAILPPKLQAILVVNPMVQLVGAYQDIILRHAWPSFSGFWPHLLGALLALGFGFFVFTKLSDEMVDEL